MAGESSCHVGRRSREVRLIPDVLLVEFDPVLPQEVPVFVLKGLGPVMLLLAVDVGDHGVQILGADGERFSSANGAPHISLGRRPGTGISKSSKGQRPVQFRAYSKFRRFDNCLATKTGQLLRLGILMKITVICHKHIAAVMEVTPNGENIALCVAPTFPSKFIACHAFA